MSPIASNMEWIRQLCALSVFCGLAMSLAPEGSVKKAGGLWRSCRRTTRSI